MNKKTLDKLKTDITKVRKSLGDILKQLEEFSESDSPGWSDGVDNKHGDIDKMIDEILKSQASDQTLRFIMAIKDFKRTQGRLSESQIKSVITTHSWISTGRRA